MHRFSYTIALGLLAATLAWGADSPESKEESSAAGGGSTTAADPSQEAGNQPSEQGSESEEAQSEQAQSENSLASLQPLVGKWRGGGQRVRGSSRGAWLENSEWAWDYEGEQKAIVFHSDNAKYYRHGRITAADEPGEYRLEAVRSDESATDVFLGSHSDDGRIIFAAKDPDRRWPAQIAFRLLAENKRLIALYQRQAGNGKLLLRMGEVGLTREGSGFGRGTSKPECVVTGGEPSIAVMYQGKTYYVCCTGCRDYFNENPEKVLAEYRERLAERKKEAGKN